MEKSDIIQRIFFNLTGNSLAFTNVGTGDWGTKRKILSAAFYKEKL
jgi:hypothetical protein